MAIEGAAELAVFFDTDEHGVSATYTPDGGEAAAVTVILDQPAEEAAFGSAGFIGVAYSAMLRASEVADPARGDAIVISGVSYTVQEVAPDETGQVLTLTLRPSS